MMKKIYLILLMMTIAVDLLAQNGSSAISDSLYASGKIYVVVACILLILLGVLFFLFSIEKRIKKLEKKSAGKN